MCDNKCFLSGGKCCEENCPYFFNHCLKCCCFDNGCKADKKYLLSACTVLEDIVEIVRRYL